MGHILLQSCWAPSLKLNSTFHDQETTETRPRLTNHSENFGNFSKKTSHLEGKPRENVSKPKFVLPSQLQHPNVLFSCPAGECIRFDRSFALAHGMGTVLSPRAAGIHHCSIWKWCRACSSPWGDPADKT